MDSKISDRSSGTTNWNFCSRFSGKAETPRCATFYFLLLYFRTRRVEVLITEIGFRLLLWKDLISDKMSAVGFSGVPKLLGDYFLDIPPVINDSGDACLLFVVLGLRWWKQVVIFLSFVILQ